MSRPRLSPLGARVLRVLSQHPYPLNLLGVPVPGRRATLRGVRDALRALGRAGWADQDAAGLWTITLDGREEDLRERERQDKRQARQVKQRAALASGSFIGPDPWGEP